MRVCALVDQNGQPIEGHRDVNLLVHDLEEIITNSRTPPGYSRAKTTDDSQCTAIRCLAPHACIGGPSV